MILEKVCIPIGYLSSSKIIEQGYTYVDKTLYITSLLKQTFEIEELKK